MLEIVEDYDTDTYRAIYTVRFEKRVYVLHIFQKKSMHGRAMSRHDMKLIQARLKRAEDWTLIHGLDGASKKGWMFVPLVEYQGGEAATVEPLKDHLKDYEQHLANNLGCGAQAYLGSTSRLDLHCAV